MGSGALLVSSRITKFFAAVIILQKTKCSRPRLAVASKLATTLRLGQVSKNAKQFAFFSLVRPVGIEPTTNRLRGGCSTD